MKKSGSERLTPSSPRMLSPGYTTCAHGLKGASKSVVAASNGPREPCLRPIRMPGCKFYWDGHVLAMMLCVVTASVSHAKYDSVDAITCEAFEGCRDVFNTRVEEFELDANNRCLCKMVVQRCALFKIIVSNDTMHARRFMPQNQT